MNDNLPQTLVDAIRYFAAPDAAFNFMVQLRWPDGVKCPRCGSADVRPIVTRKTWECKCCTTKKQFSIRVGTIFEDSPLPLDKWLAAIWMIANDKNGVSSYEVHRAIGVTQKTAWFMLQRIRLAMQSGAFEKLKGEVEIDETFIGGRSLNMHAERLARLRRGRPCTGGRGKAIVVGMLERGGEVKAMHVPHRRRSQIEANVRQHVEKGSEVFTDACRSYVRLNPDYAHQFVDHAVAYVNGKVHTNGIENFWSLLKRSIRGTYVSIDPWHLFRYLDEQVFRYNNRKTNDASRFVKAASSVMGRRLTHSELIGKTLPA